MHEGDEGRQEVSVAKLPQLAILSWWLRDSELVGFNLENLSCRLKSEAEPLAPNRLPEKKKKQGAVSKKVRHFTV